MTYTEGARGLSGSAKKPTSSSQIELVSRGYQIALKLISGPIHESLLEKVRVSGLPLSVIELEKLLKTLVSVALNEREEGRLSEQQFRSLSIVANIEYSLWPRKYRNYLDSLNLDAPFELKRREDHIKKTHARDQALRDIENRKGFQERDAQRKADRDKQEKEKRRVKEERKLAEREIQLLEENKRKAVIAELNSELRRDFVSFVNSHEHMLQTDTKERRVVLEYVKKWSMEELGVANLDDNQAAAISSISKHTQVIARAGSGKTTVLTVRLCFLMIECGLSPSSLLALTFNKKAQEEITSRVGRYLVFHHEKTRGGAASASMLLDSLQSNTGELQKQLQERGLTLPLIFNFHQLAHQINISTLGRKAPFQIEGRGSNKKDARLEDIARKMLSDEQGERRLRSILRQYFTDDFALLEERDLTKDQYLELRRHLSYETLRGEMVKSLGERRIANWLFTHQVHYNYETPAYSENRYVFPDFTIYEDAKRVGIIEFAGMLGDPIYDQNLRKKTASYYKANLPCLVLYPNDVKDDFSTGEIISRFLSSLQIGADQLLSAEEVWASVKGRVAGTGTKGKSRFVASLDQFINRAQRDGVSPSEIRREALVRLPKDAVGREFALIASEVLERYLQSLEEKNEIDQTGALNKAGELLQLGTSHISRDGKRVSLSELEHIAVDEHQDFSSQFDVILRSLHRASGATIFAVGDDWQCINRFMGSEPELFHKFKYEWQDAIQVKMPNNYRSFQEIVRVGNQLMRSSESDPAISAIGQGGEVSLYFEDKLAPRQSESSIVKDLTGRALRRILVSELLRTKDGEITVLTRTNHAPWIPSRGKFGSTDNDQIGRYITSILPGLSENTRKRIRTSTVHKFKGLESDTIIVMDVKNRSFPLIHSDQRFQNFFGESIKDLIEDERRLLYVAATRSKRRLHLITRSGSESPFIAPEIFLAEKSINDLPGGYELTISGDKNSKNIANTEFLEQKGFSLKGTDTRWRATKDVTVAVIESGDIEAAYQSLRVSDPGLYKHCLEENLQAKIKPIRS